MSTPVRLRVLVVVIAVASLLSADDGRAPTGALVVHMNLRLPSPVAVQVNSALLPFPTATLCGDTVMSGGPTGEHREHNRH